MKEKLALRKKIKSKKPDFIRTDAHKKIKIGYKWRRPKGMHNKMRLKKRGYRRSVAQGYGSPKAVKGLSKEGLKAIIVNNLNELNKIDVKTDGAIIASNVGKKKKIAIIKQAEKLKINILNMKDPKAFVEKIEAKLKERKEKRIAKEKRKKEKAKEKKEKKTIETIAKDEEEKKKEEKKEKDKLLTKKV